MCVPLWAKEGQTNCLDDSGCHSTPVQISVIVSLRGGWASSRARAEQRKALDGNYSDLSTAGAAAVYITFCTTFPGGLFGDGSAGNLQNGKRSSFFFRLLFRVPHPQAARRQGRSDGANSLRVCLEVGHGSGLLFFAQPREPLPKDFVSLCSSFTIRYYHLFIDPLRVYYGTGGGPKWIVWMMCDAPWRIIIHASRGPRGEVHRWVKGFTVASVEIDAETAGLPERREWTSTS